MSPDKEKQHQAEEKEQERSRSQDKGIEKSVEKKTSRAKTSAKAENKSAKGEREHSSSAKLQPGQSATTTDHDTIRQWVEARGGSPAAVKATEEGNDPGLLRINFPGYSGEDRLENISWDEFFKKFDAKKLGFLYQDAKRSGEESRFWKFVSREGEAKGGGKSR